MIGAFVMLLFFGKLDLQAQNPVLTDPIQYNDFIVDEQEKIAVLLFALQDEMAVEELSTEKLWSIHTDLTNQIEESKNTMMALADYDGNTEFRDAAIGLYAFYGRMVENAYRKIMEIIVRHEYTEEDLLRMEEIIAQITEEEATYDTRYQNAQTEFAARYGIELLENDLLNNLEE